MDTNPRLLAMTCLANSYTTVHIKEWFQLLCIHIYLQPLPTHDIIRKMQPASQRLVANIKVYLTTDFTKVTSFPIHLRYILTMKALFFQTNTTSQSCETKQRATVEYIPASTTACVCVEVPEAMFVNAQAASNCSEGLSGRLRHPTRIGKIPDLIKSSIGGLRSLESSFRACCTAFNWIALSWLVAFATISSSLDVDWKQ